MVTSVEDLEFETAEDGGQLRKKLEKQIESNKKLAAEVHGYRVKEVLAAGDAPLVKPEDLIGVELDEVEARAKALQAERVATGETALRAALEARNVPADKIDEFLAAQPQPEAEVERGRQERAASVRNTIGSQAGASKNDDLTGAAAIQAHFREQDAKTPF